MPDSSENCRLPETLTRRQLRALPILAIARTWEVGCKELGISTRTARAWMKQPEFVRALRHAQAEAFMGSLQKIQQLAGAAADTLRKLMKSGREGTRLRAATELLSYGLKAHDAADVERRLTELEAVLKAGRVNG